MVTPFRAYKLAVFLLAIIGYIGSRSIWSIFDRPAADAAKNQHEDEDSQKKKKKKWGCNEIPLDLVTVLEPHCNLRPGLPLSDLLPDLDYFRRIVVLVQSYPHKIHLAAGRGTTGTNSLVQELYKSTGYGSIHYYDARCQSGGSRVNRRVNKCMKKELKQTFARVAEAFQPIHGQKDATLDDYTILLNALVDGFSKTLQCGDCGDMVLMDNPFVSQFTELYLALGPKTKVILTRRGEQDWAKSRALNHGKSPQGMVCSGAWDRTPDPFSWTQCAHQPNGLATTIGGTDPAVLERAFHKYNMYVHDIVQADHLLDIDLFSSKYSDDPEAKDKWSKLNFNLVQEFLPDLHSSGNYSS